MFDMPRKLPIHVTRERSRHGRLMFYFRVDKGPRTRLPDDLGSDEFKAAYQALMRGETPLPFKAAAAPHTLKWLVTRYHESGSWAQLSPATKRQRLRFYDQAILKSGNAKYAQIGHAAISAGVQQRSHTPAEANNFLKAMRTLFAWSKLNGHVEENPCLNVERLKYKTNGFKQWSISDAQIFCEKWAVGTKPRLAFELYLCAGVRRGDMHVMGPQHRRGNIIMMRTQKNKMQVSVTLTQAAIVAIDETDTGDMAYMTKNNGTAFQSKESFGNWFGARCREAGLETGKAAHGIRKLSATLAAEAGASDHQLMAHYTWKKSEQAEIYTRGANRKRLSASSSALLEEEIENSIPRTFKSGSGNGRIK